MYFGSCKKSCAFGCKNHFPFTYEILRLFLVTRHVVVYSKEENQPRVYQKSKTLESDSGKKKKKKKKKRRRMKP
jgi:hypothetical protein